MVRGRVETSGSLAFDLTNSRVRSVTVDGGRILLTLDGLDRNTFVLVSVDYQTAGRLIEQLQDALREAITRTPTT